MIGPLASLLMGVVAIVALALIFWPDRGLVGRWQRARLLSRRILREDAVKHIHKCDMSGQRATVESLAGVLQLTLDETAGLVSEMGGRDLLRVETEGFSLTPRGRDYALHIIRAHRLWERYLADETGIDEAEWHRRAERNEHSLTPAEADALSAQLGNPLLDPHGDPIPTPGGKILDHGGQPLTESLMDTQVQIVHVEDEPEAVYRQLVAEGLFPGMTGRVTEITPQRIRFWANGEEHVLAPIVARNLSIVPAPEEEPPQQEPQESLADLEPGHRARVVSLSVACRGAERRRFMDLGILPGTLIRAEMRNPSGDPTAYRIRGALIALREDQAKLIQISRLEEVTQ